MIQILNASRNSLVAISLFVTILCASADSTLITDDYFVNLVRPPETISATLSSGKVTLHPDSPGIWHGANITVKTKIQHESLVVELIAPNVPVERLQIHWDATISTDWKYLGDAWERAYGDLEWKPLDEQRVMPWYFLASDGKTTHGYGVKTGPAALCYWTADTTGITLYADVRCGGAGVELGQRKLEVCSVICRRGKRNETPFAADREFCGEMCSKPRLPQQPVYGFNDYYCTYNADNADKFLKYTTYLASLAPKNGARPFAVVDDGWQIVASQSTQSNSWNQMNPQFSVTLDMPQFAEKIRASDVRPGLWYRPLIAYDRLP